MNQGQEPIITEGASISVAQQLGLSEEVSVKRSSGEIEGGWHIISTENHVNPETGEIEDRVQVASSGEDGQLLIKRVKLGDLRTWNPYDSNEDTIPRDLLPMPNDVFSDKPENVDSDLIEDVAEDIGEVAVEASDGVEVSAPVAQENIKEESLEGTPLPESEQRIPEQNRPDTEVAMRELAELWGMPEDMTSEQALKHLGLESQQLEQMTRLLGSFDNTRQTAAKAILDTLQGSGIVYLGDITKTAVDDFLLDHRNSIVISGFDVKDKNTLLPVRLRKDIEHFQADFKRLQRTWADATEGFRNGRPAINGEPAQQAAKLLDRSLRDLNRTLISAARQVKVKIADLGGVSDAKLAEVEKGIYRNPEWVKRAEKLKDANVDDPELEKLVTDIENSIRIESAMQDDPNSPRKWFGDQILENKGKGRQDTITSRRPQATAPSQRVAAELAADILRGRFDYSRAKGDSIDLSADGKKVILGQHRAAALAMIYGDHWIDEGRKSGLQIIINPSYKKK